MVSFCLHLQGERANLTYKESRCGLPLLHGRNPTQPSHTRSYASNTKANHWTHAGSYLLTRNGRSDAMSHQPLVSIPWNAGKMKQLILPTISNISYWGQPCYGTAQTCVLPRNGAKCLKGYTARTLLQTLRNVLMPNLSFKKKHYRQ